MLSFRSYRCLGLSFSLLREPCVPRPLSEALTQFRFCAESPALASSCPPCLGRLPVWRDRTLFRDCEVTRLRVCHEGAPNRVFRCLVTNQTPESSFVGGSLGLLRALFHLAISVWLVQPYHGFCIRGAAGTCRRSVEAVFDIAVERYSLETAKVCAQPLSLRPLPVEGDRPHRISRSAGRLRDWSKCKLHHPKDLVNHELFRACRMKEARHSGLFETFPRSYPHRFRRTFSCSLPFCFICNKTFAEHSPNMRVRALILGKNVLDQLHIGGHSGHFGRHSDRADSVDVPKGVIGLTG